MKKIIYLCTIGLALSFSSCTKDEPESLQNSKISKPTNNSGNATSTMALQPKPKPVRRTFYDDYCYCSTPQQNCDSKDVIITPHFSSYIHSMVNNAESVADFFNNNNWQECFPDVAEDATLLSELQSGNYTMVDQLNPTTNVHYYSAKNINTNAVLYVFPLTFE